MSRKLLLTKNPTFKAVAQIPVPGDRPVPVEFTFKRRTSSEMADFFEGLKARRYKDDIELLQDISSGWDLEEPFDADKLGELIEIYPGASKAVLDAYVAEQTAAKLGNSVK